MFRLLKNNRIKKTSDITTLTTDDVEAGLAYKHMFFNGDTSTEYGRIVSWWENINIGDYDLPPGYTVYTIEFSQEDKS